MSSPSSQRLGPPPTSRSGAASPKPNAEDVELSNVQNGSTAPSIPLEQDVMQCARIGALEHIQKMFQDGKVDVKFKDEEGITPLHWAAINNQYAVCKYLLEQGVDANAKGGESQATAAMWAAQRCHLYIVNLMIQHGADLLLADGQGYNILHLATIDGNALLLILLLHQNIPVDVPDPQGHTSLMWAGYKGWPACVDLLLRWGASVNAIDDNGYTPLHWALVKGSKPCLEKIIEYGADRFAKTKDGKTPATCADEMNSKAPYHRALRDQGYGADGQPLQLPMGLTNVVKDKSKMSKFFFLFPFLSLYLALHIIASFSIYIGLPLAMAFAAGSQWAAQWIGRQGPPEYQTIHKTPFLAGVFASTLFWIGIDWLFVILPTTFSTYFLSNFLFAVLYASTAYFYFLSMVEDPGYIPKHTSRNQQREVIQDLFSLWKFDEENFCVQCMIRRPLRSKHCRRCGRCVAKHDHHCPWINGCVANNNLRHFFIYILSMELGIFFFIRLVLGYLELAPKITTDTKCNILPSDLCTYVLKDSWSVSLAIWTFMQCVWVTMLIVVQSVQIAKNITTFENMKRHDRGGTHMHGPSHLPTHNARPATTGAPGIVTGLNDTAAAATRVNPAPRKPDGCLTRWKKMLGIDVFFATATDATHGKIQDRGNPFSRGIIGNCKDFWCDPAPLFGRRHNGDGFLGGEVVDYTKMYDKPLRVRRGGGPNSGMQYERVAVEDGEDDL